MSDTMERDAGFCSGGEDDDMEAEDGIHSPTDASEDSVDVKVQAISFRNKNKRKSAEPRRLDTDLPAKKRRIDLAASKIEEASDVRNSSPFRPWSTSPRDPHGRIESAKVPEELSMVFVPQLQRPEDAPVLAHDLSKVVRAVHYSDAQEEPLSLVSKKKPIPELRPDDSVRTRASPPRDTKNKYPAGGRLRNCKTASDKKVKPICDGKVKTEDGSQNSDSKFRIDSLLSFSKADSRLVAPPATKPSQGGQQRNYKNMTRERRIEANARERTRVHTISAAFDTLRHSIPAYSHNQKLSKLSVLRIACSYIMTLSRLAGYDYSKDQTEPEISNCVEIVSKTIQTEGKIRKKKDD